MARKSARSIAVVVQIVLVIVLAGLLGLLQDLLSNHPWFAIWVKTNERFWFWILGASLVVVIAAMIAVALWQQFASRGPEPATREDLDAQARKILEGFYDAARKAGGVPEQDLKAKEAEITRLTQELAKLQEELAARASEPAEAELSKLLAAGDLDGAFRVKSRQVERRQAESEKLPRDLYELGVICELRFDWPAALANFRKAWESEKTPAMGSSTPTSRRNSTILMKR